MSNPKDNFRDAVERIIWAHSNLDAEERAEVLRQFAEELEADDTPFEDMDEHIRKTLEQLGYQPPEDGFE